MMNSNWFKYKCVQQTNCHCRHPNAWFSFLSTFRNAILPPSVLVNNLLVVGNHRQSKVVCVRVINDCATFHRGLRTWYRATKEATGVQPIQHTSITPKMNVVNCCRVDRNTTGAGAGSGQFDCHIAIPRVGGAYPRQPQLPRAVALRGAAWHLAVLLQHQPLWPLHHTRRELAPLYQI